MLQSKPNNWTHEQWLAAIKKIKTLGSRKNAHWDAYYHNNKYDKMVNIPIILFSSFISAAAFSQSANNEDDTSVVPYYIITGLGMTNTILTSINKYFGFGEKKEAHRQTAFNYLELRCELAELVEKRDASGNCDIMYDDFVACYYKKMTNVRENAPILPNYIKKEMDESNTKNYNTFLNSVNSENKIEERRINSIV